MRTDTRTYECSYCGAVGLWDEDWTRSGDGRLSCSPQCAADGALMIELAAITVVDIEPEGPARIVWSESREDIEQWCDAYRVKREWIFKRGDRFGVRLWGRMKRHAQ